MFLTDWLLSRENIEVEVADSSPLHRAHARTCEWSEHPQLLFFRKNKRGVSIDDVDHRSHSRDKMIKKVN